ncbi:invasin domain 3-containing protein [Pluralibacter sp.]|uniref:invasin domain 3-containing protein n=1 Tax=Pluralibacter sp. TaxID=1920032 RepID=UPI0025D246C6|nr:invasin domain 3-containing protein [Pluralibacter sp.]MBV8041779.1 Ig-like domain-containing protein [Pluralibacter sp.]
MSNTNELFPVVRDEIDFETLLAQAMQVLKTSSGQYWTDMAEHDPGITLLETQGYGVADLAYRQTRPLTDLLTPEVQPEGEGLFPPEFGPQQALTCGPISEEDYRRALLDLRSTDTEEGYFLFLNAQLIREPEAERYEYWYDTTSREYSFIQPPTQDSAISLELLGNYHLYLLPSRETLLNPEVAQAVLDIFLRNNRNLGEAVSKIIWLEPEDFSLQVVIELEDDIGTNSNIAAILADIYQVAENYVTPAVQHVSTEQLLAEGMRSEDIHQGPWLQYGWIPRLPSPIEGTTPAVVNLSGLVSALQDVAGVKGIRHLEALADNSVSSRWEWETRGPGVYPLLWGSDPLAVLADGDLVELLASGDVQLTASRDAIAAELERPALIHNEEKVMPYGRWRNPGRYYPATDLVPPCYNLRIPAGTQQQTQLHQFLLAFEQLLADGCQQLALLPALLSFRREGDAVWGHQWPFNDDSVSDEVHQAYRQTLERYLARSRHDREQELAITGFLLGYFNSLLAPAVFSQPANRFLASQQGFLSRHTELTYHRSNIRVDKVSALHRRIAARLGLGGAEIFDDKTSLEDLPFYLVEHRALMPVQPLAQYDEPQTPVIARLQSDEDRRRYLVISSTNLSGIKKGQMIDLLLHYGSTSVLRIRGQMVIRVDEIRNNLWLDVEASRQLEFNLDTILELPPEELAWQNSPVWLEDMDYPLRYDDDQSDLAADEKRLICSPFPVMVQKEDWLVLEYMTTSVNPGQGADLTGQRLQIVSMDRIANTLIVRAEESFPSDDECIHYQWHLDNANASTDRFSFMLSVVFNQQLLLGLTSDPYATEVWVREVILAEIPSHTGVLIHWKPWWEFQQFAKTYSDWQNGRAVLGDSSYELMYLLALGQLPAPLQGVGSMYIATPEQKTAVVGSDGSEWNSEVIIQDQLLYVPDVGQIALVVTGNDVVADGVQRFTVTLTVLDEEGIPQSGLAVAFAADNSALIGASGITDANGIATQTLTSTRAGNCTVTATVNELSRQEVVTFIPGEPADTYSALTAVPSSIVADGEEISTITWMLRDAHDNAITGRAADVSFDVSPVDGIILASVTEEPVNSGSYTTLLSGVLTTAVTVTISPMLSGQVTGSHTTTVSLTPAAPQPMTGYAEVNGHQFDLSASDKFPQTGFPGAEFRLVIDGDASNNSSYDWDKSQGWLTVDASGNVSFTGTPAGATKTVVITATPKIPGLAAQSYTFTLQKWFTNMEDTTRQHWELDLAATPATGELTNSTNVLSPSSAQLKTVNLPTRGELGILWSEWGALSFYSTAGFVSGDSRYWTDTDHPSTTMYDKVSLETGDVYNGTNYDMTLGYVVHRIVL